MEIKHNIVIDNYVNYLVEKYDIDLEKHSKTIIPDVDIEELDSIKWNVGLICGNSGSGKSTLSRKFPKQKELIYDYSKCIVSQFPKLTQEETMDLLLGVGLSSIPLLLHKPNELSTGQRARLDIAMSIYLNDGIIVIDEFTSTVNRNCAYSIANSLQRYIRQNNKKIVLITCHFDLFEWLKPDWVINMNKKNSMGNVEIDSVIYSDEENFKQVDEKYILYEGGEI